MPDAPPQDGVLPLAGDGTGDRRTRVAELYDLHGAGLYRYAVMLLGNPIAAEDAVQQVFVAVLRQAALPRHETHYLRRAVRNQCYSMLRARRVSPHEALERPLLESCPGREVDPAERLALEQALLALPPEQREVIHLHSFEGWTFRQIADALEESINTVAARYRYALTRLRKSLTTGADHA